MDAMICDCRNSRYGLIVGGSTLGRDAGAEAPAAGGVDGADAADGVADGDVVDGGVTVAGFSSDGVGGTAPGAAADVAGATGVTAAELEELVVVVGDVAEPVTKGVLGVAGAVGAEASTTEGPGMAGGGPSGDDDGDDTAGVMFVPDEEGSRIGSTTLGFSTRRSAGSRRLVRSSCCTSRSRTFSSVLLSVATRPSRLISTSRRFTRNASISR